MRMELRQLRYFVAVADELHSAGCTSAQPAVSEQVRKLDELDVSLLYPDQAEGVADGGGE